MKSRQIEAETAGTSGNSDEPKAAGRKKAMPALRPLAALAPYVLRHKGMLIATILALFAAASATLAVPLAVRRMIDFGFSNADGGFIDRYFAVLGLVGLVLALASAARFYCVNWLGERVVAELRADVFKKLTSLSPAFYETTQSGEVMSRLTADTTQIKVAVSVAFSQTLRNLLLLIGALAMMLVTSAKLSILVLLAIPIIVLPLVFYGRAVRKLSRTAQDTLARGSAYAAENLSAIRTMQAFTHEETAVARYGAEAHAAFDASRARMRARAGLTAIAIFLVFASVVGILWYGASGVLAGTMSGGRLGQFVLYAVFAAGALAELSEVWGEITQAAGAAERLQELLLTESTIVSPANPKPLPQPARGAVSFRDVRFNYPTRPDDMALQGLSFEVAPGETVAIVGPSGAGKSTIFSLLLRFYDPQGGHLEIDGVRIDEADLTALRKRIAVVPQEVELFADSVLENIRYGAPQANDDDVRAAAETATADGFIKALPDGYGTKLGERGVMLSGGQRQRIAIARAVLRDAPILLLDEATSALDAESEALIQKALERVMDGRTTLVIAHRLATVKRADRILVLDGGRIVEEGTHETLLAKGGIYQRLAKLQFIDDRHEDVATSRAIAEVAAE